MSDRVGETLWTSRELAKFLRYSESTVAAMVSRSPDKLPPRVPHLDRPRWNPTTVREWSAGGATAARRGRPRAIPAS